MQDVNKKENFKSLVRISISTMFNKIMSASGKDSLSYLDARTIADYVRCIFKSRLGFVPMCIEMACKSSEKILSPSEIAAQNDERKIVGIAGRATGAGMTVYGVGKLLGWRSGIISRIATFFVGTSMAGPIAWGAAGLSLFALLFDNESKNCMPEQTEHFIQMLTESVNYAIDQIWDKCGDKLVA